MSRSSSHLSSPQKPFLRGYLKLPPFNPFQTALASRADLKANNRFHFSFSLSSFLSVFFFFSSLVPEAKSYVKTHLFLMDFLMNFLAGLLIQALIMLRRAVRGENGLIPSWRHTLPARSSNAWPTTHTHTHTHERIISCI